MRNSEARREGRSLGGMAAKGERRKGRKEPQSHGGEGEVAEWLSG